MQMLLPPAYLHLENNYSKYACQLSKEKNKPTIQLDGDVLRNILNQKTLSRRKIFIRIKVFCLCKLIIENNINVVIGVVGLFHKLFMNKIFLIIGNL